MTKITIFKRGRDIAGFVANEHAGDGDEVGEIVCHGISALTLTCILSLESLAGISEEQMSVEQSDAFLSVRLGEHAVTEKSDLIFRSMLVGLEAIEDKYEQYIKIETQEV